jgi:hypothetical protein
MLTLAETARRMENGTSPHIALKEHVDAWNWVPTGTRPAREEMFAEEPVWLPDLPWMNAWLAGAAEYEAFLIGAETPAWALKDVRFLRAPFVSGGANARKYALVETPFAWRRRMVFTGKTGLAAREKNDG